MNIIVFDLSMAIGWLMFLAGSVWVDAAVGLMASGVLLIVLVLIAVRIAGGVYQDKGEGR